MLRMFGAFSWQLFRFFWGVPIPVFSSIVTMSVGYLGFRMAAHPLKAKDHKKKRNYKIAFVVLSMVIVALTWWQSIRDSNDKKDAYQAYTNQLSDIRQEMRAVKEDDTKLIQSLKALLSTNQSVSAEKRLEILENEKRQVETEGSYLKNIATEIKYEPFNLEKLKRAADLNRAIESNNIVNAEIEARHRQIEQETQEQARLDGEKMQQERNSAIEKKILNNTIITFEYAIKKLHENLALFRTAAGQNEFFDFDREPSFHFSKMMSGANIVEGTNYIHLGTNKNWYFEISTVLPDKTLTPFQLRTKSPAVLKLKSKYNENNAIEIRPSGTLLFNTNRASQIDDQIEQLLINEETKFPHK